MASKVISFRLSDSEVEILESLKSPDDEESLSVTAARLLRNILGTSTDDNKPVDNIGIQEIIRREIKKLPAEYTKADPVDSAYIQDLVSQELQKAIAQLRQEISQPTDEPVSKTAISQETEERLHKLEDRWNEIERFEAEFNVWIDDLKDVSRLSCQVNDLSSKVEYFDETLNTFALRVVELMEHWNGKVSETVDKMDRKLLKYYGDVRDDTLKKLKVGEQSAQSRGIDRFIKELEKYGEEY
jgi:DNA repair exonuclease SbcCD ATPase subunit